MTKYNIWDSDRREKLTTVPAGLRAAQKVLIRVGFTPWKSLELLNRADPDDLAFEYCGITIEAVTENEVS